jgi:ABC-type glycerol-3-phosphate transport system substrate-binding protein
MVKNLPHLSQPFKRRLFMNNRKPFTLVGIALSVVIALGTQANAQEKKITKKDVPVAVVSAFEKAYPDAKVKGYSTETEDGKTTFEIESLQGKLALDVAYLPDGTPVEIEEEVAAGSLPAVVKAAVKSNFSNGKIAKAEKKTVGTVVTYEMRVKTSKKTAEVEIDPSGAIIKKANKGGEKEERD